MIYLEKDVNLLEVRGEYNGEQVTYSADGIYAYLVAPGS